MIKFTRIRLIEPRRCGRKFSLDADGQLAKETVGWISKGTAFVVEMAGLTPK
jgi:hypothetical protein